MSIIPVPSAAPADESATQSNTNEVSEVSTAPASEKFDVFVRKEKQLRNRIRELEAREASFKQKESEFVPKSRLVEDPLSVLADHGITYEKLSEMVMNSPNSQDPAIKALRAEIMALKDGQSKNQEAEQTKVREQYDRALNHIRNQVKQTVDSDGEFESIKEAGMYEAVVELIEESYNADGILMDVKQAAKQVEEQIVAEAMRMYSLKKVQEKLKAQHQPTEPAKPKDGMLPPKTLTNTLNTQSPTKPVTNEKDRIARAIAAFKGQPTS